MHVYIDDSGCGGFKLDRGSSRFLVMSACIFDTKAALDSAGQAINTYNTTSKFTPVGEFKYAKNHPRIKDGFFEVMKAETFRVRSLVIDKPLLYEPFLQENPSELKAWAIMMLLSRHWGTIQNAKVIIDGRDGRAFGTSDSAYFMRKVNAHAGGTIREVAHRDSKQNVMLQLADMLAGATRNHYEFAYPDATSHVETFRRRTWMRNGGSMWEFKSRPA